MESRSAFKILTGTPTGTLWTLLHSPICNLLAVNWLYWQTRKKCTHAYAGSRSPHASALHWNQTSFRKKLGYFFNNGNPTKALNTTSLKCYLPSTDATDRREKNSRMGMKVQGRLIQARFIEIHQVFVKKKKAGYFSNRPRTFQEEWTECSLSWWGRWFACYCKEPQVPGVITQFT